MLSFSMLRVIFNIVWLLDHVIMIFYNSTKSIITIAGTLVKFLGKVCISTAADYLLLKNNFADVYFNSYPPFTQYMLQNEGNLEIDNEIVFWFTTCQQSLTYYSIETKDCKSTKYYVGI